MTNSINNDTRRRDAINCVSTPKLRFPEFTGEWEKGNLGEIFTFRSTNSFSRDNLNYDNGEVKNIHYGDIHTKFQTLFDVTKETVPFINAEMSIDRISNDNYCQEGDLILADASEDLNDVGKSIEMVNVGNQKLLSGLHTILARPQKDVFSIGFNGYLFKSNNVRTQIQKESQGSKVLSISTTRLLNISLSFPKKEEQTKIANFLTTVDNKLTQLKKKKSLLEQYKKGVMQRIFSGFDRDAINRVCMNENPASDRDAINRVCMNENPASDRDAINRVCTNAIRFKDENGNDFEEWEEKKLGDMISLVIDNRGKTPPTIEMGIPLLEVNSIGNKEINYKAVSKYVTNETYNNWFRKYLEKGDILFSTVGNTALCSYFDGSKKAGIAQNIVGLRFKNELSLFMYYLLIEERNRNKFKQIEMGAVQPSVKVSQMVDLYFDVPTLPEQTKIANFLSAIDEKINHCGVQIEKMEVWKKGLLQRMFV